MRRRRRIDVIRSGEPDGAIVADVYFRDSFVEPDGVESVVHEYSIAVVVGAHDHTVKSIVPTAHVLPSPECPAALASAQRLVGMHVSEIRAHVRDRFRGTSTCTHLNDALRSIGDLDALIATLDAQANP
jgi:hypothetical protein